jgi:RNA polymerase sigma factor for flagellar operon FliA
MTNYSELDEEQLWSMVFDRGDQVASELAREQIILRYQFLVNAAAHKLKTALPTYIQKEDLVSYGQIGLLRAVDAYDPAKAKFRSFAYTKIYGAMMDELRSQDWAPRGLRRDQRTINAARKDLEEDNPSSEAISNHLGWTSNRVDSTIKKVENSKHVQLSDRHVVVSSADNPEASAVADDMCRVFVSILDSLPVRHHLIIVRKYFLNQTLSSIAEEMKLSAVYVRSVHQDVLMRVHATVKELAAVS